MSCCRLCLDQLLESDPPEELIVVNNQGAPAFAEHGITPIPQGASSVAVLFATQKASTQLGFNELAVVNTVDPSPLTIQVNLGPVSLAGFTAILSGAPDSGNYFLRWDVEVQEA